MARSASSRSFRCVLCASALGTLAAVAHSQSPRLAARGASLPGTLELVMDEGPVGLTGVLFLSGNAGPTPLFPVDPRDPRSLDIGSEALGISFSGIFVPGGAWSIRPSLPLPNDPGLIGAPLFFQAVTFPGTQYLLGPLSNPSVIRFAPANAFRTRNTQFVTPRAFFPVIPRADRFRWMIVGGGIGGLLAQVAQKTTEIYDPLTDGFLAGPTMTTERSLHTVTQLGNGRWLLVGGVDRLNDPQTACEVFDPGADAFTAVAPMNDPRTGHTATLLPNGKVLVTGGLSDLNPTPNPILSTLKSTEIYDPATNQWTRGPDMRVPRAAHAAIPLANGKVVLVGGVGWIQILIKIPSLFREIDVYDPATNTIAPGPLMAQARAAFPVAELGGGRYLFAGGLGSLLAADQTTAQAEVYDASTNACTPAGNMARARGLHAALPLANRRWLLLGGAYGTIDAPTALNTTEVYDAATNSWSAGPAMTSSRAGFGLFATPNGNFHLMGGGNGPSSTVVNTTEWFYP